MKDSRPVGLREAAWLAGYAGLYAVVLALLHVRESFDLVPDLVPWLRTLGSA